MGRSSGLILRDRPSAAPRDEDITSLFLNRDAIIADQRDVLKLAQVQSVVLDLS
jgi:hypothetical protein